MTAKVSVIVPIYNNIKFLKRCVESIENQTYKNLEIILIDDGSTDGSSKLCDDLVVNDSRVHVYHNMNHGVSYSRNYGINKAHGDFIFFCDSDDYLDREIIQKLVFHFQKNAICRTSYKKIFRKSTKTIEPITCSKKQFIYNILNGKEDGYCWGYLFEKKVIRNLKFDENSSFMEDLEFLLRYVMQVDTVISVNENSYYNYIDNSNGISSAKNHCLKKIKDVQYTLSKIEQLLIENNYSDIHSLIDNKRISMLNYLTQNMSHQEIAFIFKNDEICLLLNRVKKNKLSIKNKVFVDVIRKKNLFLFDIYKMTRRVLKRIKVGE